MSPMNGKRLQVAGAEETLAPSQLHNLPLCTGAPMGLAARGRSHSCTIRL